MRGATLDVAPPNAAPRALALPTLPNGAKLLASAGGVAYYFTGTDQEGSCTRSISPPLPSGGKPGCDAAR